MAQRDDKVKMLEMFIQTISKYIESQIVSTTVNTTGAVQNSSGEFRDDGEYVKSKPFTTHSIKLDFPRFDGEEVLNWIYKAEQFFKYYRATDAE